MQNQKIARLNWVRSEHGKNWLKNYMKNYRKRPEVKIKQHEYYLRKKIRDNDLLNAKNSEKFINYEKRN